MFALFHKGTENRHEAVGESADDRVIKTRLDAWICILLASRLGKGMTRFLLSEKKHMIKVAAALVMALMLAQPVVADNRVGLSVQAEKGETSRQAERARHTTQRLQAQRAEKAGRGDKAAKASQAGQTNQGMQAGQANNKQVNRPPQKMDIPPGHLPPAGSCRIWHPGTPPGRQPAPGDCRTLRNQIPAGAWLIQRPQQDPERYEIFSGVRETYPDGDWPDELEPGERSGLGVIVDIYEAVTGERIEGMLSR